jgi:hypothetical protein
LFVGVAAFATVTGGAALAVAAWHWRARVRGPFDAESVSRQGGVTMAEVSERVRLSWDADSAWDRFGGFGAVGEWHPLLADVESSGEEPGAISRVRTVQGQQQVENPPGEHEYRYVVQRTELSVGPISAGSGSTPPRAVAVK